MTTKKKPVLKNPIGLIREAKKFSKEIILIRAHCILMRDEYGQVIYTFLTKKKADEFYNELTKK